MQIKQQEIQYMSFGQNIQVRNVLESGRKCFLWQKTYDVKEIKSIKPQPFGGVSIIRGNKMVDYTLTAVDEILQSLKLAGVNTKQDGDSLVISA